MRHLVAAVALALAASGCASVASAQVTFTGSYAVSTLAVPDRVTVTMTVRNDTAADLTNLGYTFTAPMGADLRSATGNTCRMSSSGTNSKFTFRTGTLAAGESCISRLSIVPAVPGRYPLSASTLTYDGAAVSGLTLAPGTNPVLTVGQPAADGFASVATFSASSWSVRLVGFAPDCDVVEELYVQHSRPTVFTIDGVDFAVQRAWLRQGTGADVVIGYSSLGGPLPDGTFQRMTVDGQTSMPCGSGIIRFPTGPTPVSTLSDWAMILLALALAGGAALTIHRRRTA